MPRNGNTTARGYGSAHQAKRTEWEPLVAAGYVRCHADVCKKVVRTNNPHARTIGPYDLWDLGHDYQTGAWRGPEHQECNRSEGAARGNRGRAGPRRRIVSVPVVLAPLRTSRRWV